MIERLQRFLERLWQGEFEDQREEAFKELNLAMRQFEKARDFLSAEYLPELYEATEGRQKLIFIASETLDRSMFNLALVVAEALVRIYSCHPEDQLILSILMDVVLTYNLYDVLDLESGRTFRFEADAVSFTVDVDLIRSEVRLRLLKFALNKYSKLLVDDGPPTTQELPSIVDRLEAVIGLLLGFHDANELVRHTALQPFTRDQVSYVPELARWLFGSEMSIGEYEKQLFELYRIPLFPMIKTDKLTFEEGRLAFTNEGRGALPPSEVRVQVAEKEFELGVLSTYVPPDEKQDLFVEEDAAFGSFLLDQNPNFDVKVVFSFSKFDRSYDLGVLARSVGHWREGISEQALERGVLYEIPLEQLSERDFERLCLWIVSESPHGLKFEEVLWLNEEGGAERGRDITAVEAETGSKWVFQCKRVKQYGPKDIEEELTRFERYVQEDPTIKPDVYVLFISRPITDKTKSIGDQLSSRIGMEIKYWSRSSIDHLVRTNEVVKDRFWAKVR
jgi:hypothetical protein